MALRVRFQYPSGASLGYSIERLRDGLHHDFSDGTFKASPTTPVSALSAGTGHLDGEYAATLANTPAARFTDGEYAIGIHDMASSSQLIALLGATMQAGDDAPAPPSASADPWAAVLPGTYGPGTAGAILGNNLDARVSTRSTFSGGLVAGVLSPVTVGKNNDKTGYALTQAFPANFSAMAVSPGGELTVGTVRDKAGYALAANGLDAVPVEGGINARQALAPILAAAAGTVSGAGTGTVVIAGANVDTTRIVATTDRAGNRTNIQLTLPA